MRRHGFNAGELERARRELLAQYDRAWQERDKTESPSYAREYVSNFLTGEPSPGIDVERALARRFLPAIGLEEVRDVTTRSIHDDNRVVLEADSERLRNHGEIKEFYLGQVGGARRSYRTVKQYRRSRRWYG